MRLAWITDARLVLRSRLALATLLALALVAAVAVAAGLAAVDAQREAIARASAAQQAEFAGVAAQYDGRGDAAGDIGSLGYYGFHATSAPPSALAFVALGQRDVQPALLRVRLLGLQQQLYESDAANPELALPGGFDLMVVVVYLMPLVAIALVHDLASGEREAGRLGLLLATAARPAAVFRRRLLVRLGLVLAALLLPFAVGAGVAGAPPGPTLQVAVVITLYAAFWFGIAALVAARMRGSAASALALLALWVALTLLLPTAAHALIQRGVPAAQGVELMLAQRQQVHAGWDLPKEDTFERFFRTHPEWRGTAPVEGRFHWKWYYAMHQVGDESVAADVAAWRAALRRRQAWAERAGWLMPGVAAQVAVQRLADTDLEAQLAYLDAVGDFHAALRRHAYPFLFEERAFGPADVASMPRYVPPATPARTHPQALAALGLLALLALAAGWRRLRRIG